MLDRLAPLGSGRDTEIDMIEREMEGGVVVIQPPDVHEHNVEERVGGLIASKNTLTSASWALSRWFPKREISLHTRFAQQDDLAGVHREMFDHVVNRFEHRDVITLNLPSAQ